MGPFFAYKEGARHCHVDPCEAAGSWALTGGGASCLMQQHNGLSNQHGTAEVAFTKSSKKLMRSGIEDRLISVLKTRITAAQTHYDTRTGCAHVPAQGWLRRRSPRPATSSCARASRTGSSACCVAWWRGRSSPTIPTTRTLQRGQGPSQGPWGPIWRLC